MHMAQRVCHEFTHEGKSPVYDGHSLGVQVLRIQKKNQIDLAIPSMGVNFSPFTCTDTCVQQTSMQGSIPSCPGFLVTCTNPAQIHLYVCRPVLRVSGQQLVAVQGISGGQEQGQQCCHGSPSHSGRTCDGIFMGSPFMKSHVGRQLYTFISESFQAFLRTEPPLLQKPKLGFNSNSSPVLEIQQNLF